MKKAAGIRLEIATLPGDGIGPEIGSWVAASIK